MAAKNAHLVISRNICKNKNFSYFKFIKTSEENVLYFFGFYKFYTKIME